MKDQCRLRYRIRKVRKHIQSHDPIMTPQFSTWKDMQPLACCRLPFFLVLVISEILALKQTFMIKTYTYICIWYICIYVATPLTYIFIESSVICNYKEAKWDKNIFFLLLLSKRRCHLQNFLFCEIFSDLNNKINNKTRQLQQGHSSGVFGARLWL